jgi:sugar-specific transcriptional regulator TrmB
MPQIEDINILSHFGLNKNDISVYAALCKLGRSKTGQIIIESGVVSSRVYESLKALSLKGLVSYEVKNNIKYYKAELPDQLIEETINSAEKLKKLSDTIKSTPIEKESRNETNTYEGVHGFKQAFLQHIQAIEKNEDVSIIAFSTGAVIKQRYGKLKGFFNDLDKIMFPKTKNVQMLLNKSMLDTLKKDRPMFNSYTKRFLPAEYFNPTAINISAREVMISVWGDKPIVFTIKNPVAVASFKKNFEFLWSIANKQK